VTVGTLTPSTAMTIWNQMAAGRMYAARRMRSGLGKPGLIFLIGLEQHSAIDRYITEFLDDRPHHE
jgi:hypothetical protein